jgi:putative Mg2+ transporter-C (MgtC) family protein
MDVAGVLGDWRLQASLVGTVAFAMLLGGVIGWEREARHRPAGLRTHMLIAGAATLLLGISDLLTERFNQETYSQLLSVDPIRVIQAVVTAVAFIGAGTIIQHARRNVVVGLTTASSLLLTAAMGIAVGLKQYVLAIGVTVLALLVLQLLWGSNGEDS